jgi:hypothetical protein
VLVLLGQTEVAQEKLDPLLEAPNALTEVLV